MDRKRQFSNVSFGGAWSEQIAEDDALKQAMARLDHAVIDTLECDLREDIALVDALAKASAAHPKGLLLMQAWGRALTMINPDLRSAELKRIAAVLRSGIGSRLNER